jgi:hypothetical protein
VKSFTKSWLTSGFWIAYVYLACLLTLSLLRFAIRVAVDLVGRSNAFWLRNAIARERAIIDEWIARYQPRMSPEQWKVYTGKLDLAGAVLESLRGRDALQKMIGGAWSVGLYVRRIVFRGGINSI